MRGTTMTTINAESNPVEKSEHAALRSVLSEDEPGRISRTAIRATATAQAGDSAKAAALHRKVQSMHLQAAAAAEGKDGDLKKRHLRAAFLHKRAAASLMMSAGKEQDGDDSDDEETDNNRKRRGDDSDDDSDDDDDDTTDNQRRRTVRNNRSAPLVPMTMEALCKSIVANRKAEGSNSDYSPQDDSDRYSTEDQFDYVPPITKSPGEGAIDDDHDDSVSRKLFGRGMPMDDRERENRRRQGMDPDSPNDTDPDRPSMDDYLTANTSAPLMPSVPLEVLANDNIRHLRRSQHRQGRAPTINKGSTGTGRNEPLIPPTLNWDEVRRQQR